MNCKFLVLDLLLVVVTVLFFSGELSRICSQNCLQFICFSEDLCEGGGWGRPRSLDFGPDNDEDYGRPSRGRGGGRGDGDYENYGKPQRRGYQLDYDEDYGRPSRRRGGGREEDKGIRSFSSLNDNEKKKKKKKGPSDEIKKYNEEKSWWQSPGDDASSPYNAGGWGSIWG